MITIVNTCNVNTGDNYNEYMGKSTDVKPTVDVPNGSCFYEMDTGAFWVFDLEARTWIVQ